MEICHYKFNQVTGVKEVDALYIRFIETTVTTQHVAEEIAVDYAADGRIAGIEIPVLANASVIQICFGV